MKKIYLLLLLLIGLGATAQAQTYPVYLSGRVYNFSSGTPAANWDVNIVFDTLQTGGGIWTYNNVVGTDGQGNWADTINIPTSIMQGNWQVWTLDCNRLTVLDTAGFFGQNPAGNYYSNLDFNFCSNTLPPNCTADFSASVSGTSASFSDLSSAQTSITSWSWDFGDGNSSTSQNPAHTYAQNGVYQVCLDITTSGGCTSQYCDAVTVAGGGSTPPYTLSGMLLDTTNPMRGAFCSGEVYLIEHDQQAGTLTAIDTVLVDSLPNGMGCIYTFSNVQPGNYLIKGALLPSNPDYANVMPTYYSSDLFWSGATTVNVNGNLTGLDIAMIWGNNPGGPGFVGGLISQGANKTHGVGDPVPNVQVMLLNMDDSGVQYVYSNAQGEYSFSNVAYGTYKVWAEIPGKTTTPLIVTIDGNQPSAEDQNIWVNSSDIVAGVVAPQLVSALQVYPNPVTANSVITFGLERAGEVKMEVVDLAGRVVKTESYKLAAGEQVLDLDLETQADGFYFLKLEMDGQSVVKKLMKK